VSEAYTTWMIIYNTLLAGFAMFLTYLGLNKEAFTLFAALLFIDYLTGVGKAGVLGQSITSNKMKYGIASKMVLLFIPIVLAIGAKIIKHDAEDILFVGINILVLSEVYSIIGNIYSMRTKEELPEIDAVAAIGKFIRDKLIALSGGEK